MLANDIITTIKHVISISANSLNFLLLVAYASTITQASNSNVSDKLSEYQTITASAHEMLKDVTARVP